MFVLISNNFSFSFSHCSKFWPAIFNSASFRLGMLKLPGISTHKALKELYFQLCHLVSSYTKAYIAK